MTDEEAMEELLNSDGYSFPTWTLTLGVRGISGIVRCTNIFPPMKTAVSSRFGTERVVEPARAFRLPDHTPTRLGLSMCL